MKATIETPIRSFTNNIGKMYWEMQNLGTRIYLRQANNSSEVLHFSGFYASLIMPDKVKH